MAGRPDPNKETILYLRIRGGDATGTATLAPKVGPLGLSPKKIGDDCAAATKDWKGLKVRCKLIIKNRQATVEVVPTAANLIIKALNEPYVDKKNRPEGGIRHEGNLSMDDILKVVVAVREKSMARDFSGTVCEILGTATSIGCTVENRDPRDIIQEVRDGKYDDKFPSS
eukprot:TRINITY_DN1171_c0_g1_i1.p1 TRINITY_DN1171_c0_g1~~TRINITY_DN1171_c0_g1_i1.p1  ORF type:complete len:170 (-),score=45.58 TRINITY_DN1171_c0_g1_i1:84-593(-)